MEQLRQNKGYIFAILILSLTGGIWASYHPRVVDSIILHALATASIAVAMNCLFGFLILLISWIFTRKITVTRFFIFSTIVCAIWALSPIIQGDTTTIEDALTSDDFVRWNKDQQITFDQFKGEGPENAYSMWIGFYFIWDLTTDEFKFNVTTFMDKSKSYVAETTDQTDTDKVALFPTMYKLKFDFYEVYARQFRKYLLENQKDFDPDSREDIESLSSKYFDEAEKAWKVIIDDLETNNGYNKEKFDELRTRVDSELDMYKDFDSAVNNYDSN